MTSTTVVNPRNAVPGAPTGSVWTLYGGHSHIWTVALFVDAE